MIYILAGLAAAIWLFLTVFYSLYVLVMGVYRAHLLKQLRWYHYALLGWGVLIGFVVDIFANIFVAPFFFREMAREWLVTTRLKRYLNDPEAHIHNKMIATWVCAELLDLFDPKKAHCK